MRLTENELQSIILNKVLTLTEIKLIWGKDKKTIMMAIYKDRLIARQALGGSTWLVLKSSVVKLWGKPPESSKDEELD